MTLLPKKKNVPKLVNCSACGGTGSVNGKTCTSYNGKGKKQLLKG